MRWCGGAVLVLAAVAVLAPAAPAARAGCTDARAAADTYAGGMAKARAAYFRAHRRASARTRFVAAQKAKLAALRAAESAACTTISAVLPAPAPTANEHFLFTDDVPQWSRDEIQGDIAYAVQDEQTLFGVDLGEVNVFVSGDHAWLAQRQCDLFGRTGDCVASTQAYYDAGYGTQTGPGAVFVNWTASDGTWKELNNPQARWIRQKILAHELASLFQYRLEGREGDPAPAWLSFALTEMTGYRVAGDRNLHAYSLSQEQMRTSAKVAQAALQDALTWDDVDRLQGQGADHWFYAAAADRLVADAPSGTRSFAAYWSGIGRDTAWPDAFASAFGLSVDAFYADFAAYRKGL